jgi:hypothetical protein
MRGVVAALATVLALASTARADRPDPLDKVAEGEIAFGIMYQTSDAIGLTGYMGFSLAKPLLGACYLEPVLSLEIDITQSSRVTGMIRCNFVTSIGSIFSLGVGAGTGWHSVTDNTGTVTGTSPMTFRQIEIADKIGGKHRFLLGLAVAFDSTSGDRMTYLLQTTFVRAYP